MKYDAAWEARADASYFIAWCERECTDCSGGWRYCTDRPIAEKRRYCEVPFQSPKALQRDAAGWDGLRDRDPRSRLRMA